MQNSSNNKPKIWPRVEAFPTAFTLLILSLGIYISFDTWDEPDLRWVGWPFLGLGILLTVMLTHIVWSEWRARVTASEKGLSVERMLHDPNFFDPEQEYDSDRAHGYKPRKAFAYILPHRERKNATWALLMPEIDRKATYPNGWKLVVKEGAVSDALKETIAEIAGDELWKKHLVWLEVQSYPDKIQAIWDEGDREVARRLFEIMSRLSEKAE
jgi:hypothetical protein